LIIGFILNASEDREDLERLVQRLEDGAAGFVLKMPPFLTPDHNDFVVLEKEVCHVKASPDTPPRCKPRCPSCWIGSDRRWG
jgi:hypothetical protein